MISNPLGYLFLNTIHLADVHCNMQCPDLEVIFQEGLIKTEQNGRITSYNLDSMLLLIQPKIIFAFLVHYWFLFKLQSNTILRSFSNIMLGNQVASILYLCLSFFFLSRCKNLHFFVKIHPVISVLLKPRQFLLRTFSFSLIFMSCTFDQHTLKPLIQVINKTLQCVVLRTCESPLYATFEVLSGDCLMSFFVMYSTCSCMMVFGFFFDPWT